MSLYFRPVTATIASSGTTSGEVDLGENCDFVRIQIPTIDSSTIKLQVSLTTGGTFQDLGDSVTTATTTGAYSTMFRLGGWRFVKVVTSAAQSSGAVDFELQGMKI